MINQYFNSNYNGNKDQQLIQSLIEESIRIYGFSGTYVSYELINEDPLLGEATIMNYCHAYDLEMYLQNTTSWEGSEDLLSKFGVENQETGQLMFGIERFRSATNHTLYRPREKDLIYIPWVDELFEITYCIHDNIFHQLGALQVYSCRVQLFNYSNQKLRTTMREIDKFENLKAFVVDFHMGTGTGRYIIGEQVYQGTSLATATAKARVVFYDRDNKILKVKDLSGTFDNTLPIIGSQTNVSYTIASVDELELPNSPVSDNKQIKDSVGAVVDPILDFSEQNPFGEPRR